MLTSASPPPASLAAVDGSGRASRDTADTPSSQSDLQLRAAIAEHAERYEDMYDVMKQLVEAASQPLSFDERCLFSIACKHSIAPRRAAWRLLATRETQLHASAAAATQAGAASAAPPSSSSTAVSSRQRESQLLASYRQAVQAELLQRIEDILLLLSSHLMPAIHPKLHRELSVLLTDLHNRQSREESREGEDSHTARAEDEITAFLLQLNSKQPFIPLLTSSSMPSPAAGASAAHSPSSPPNPQSAVSKASFSPSLASALVFYYKMSGDMRRYCAELTAGTPRLLASHALHAQLQYGTAAALTTVFSLPPSWPLCLSLALNRAVFEYEVNMQPERAISIAKAGYDRAVEAGVGRGKAAAEDEVDMFPETDGGDGSDGDSELIKRLLKDNLTLWSSLT